MPVVAGHLVVLPLMYWNVLLRGCSLQCFSVCEQFGYFVEYRVKKTVMFGHVH